VSEKGRMKNEKMRGSVEAIDTTDKNYFIFFFYFSIYFIGYNYYYLFYFNLKINCNIVSLIQH